MVECEMRDWIASTRCIYACKSKHAASVERQARKKGKPSLDHMKLPSHSVGSRLGVVGVKTTRHRGESAMHDLATIIFFTASQHGHKSTSSGTIALPIVMTQACMVGTKVE